MAEKEKHVIYLGIKKIIKEERKNSEGGEKETAGGGGDDAVISWNGRWWSAPTAPTVPKSVPNCHYY